MKLLILTTALLFGNAWAKELPPVQAPRELTEISSEFAEGTITRLSAQDVSVFVPWAQNAQSVLTKALKDVQTMTVQDQVRHLTLVIKSVVTNSGQKNYQMFMRFALNRTLLLVKELTVQSDWNVPGTPESVLDLQVKGINLALQFYESDLAYQNRVNAGNNSVTLSYAQFASAFGRTMLQSIQNITDASAQYRLLYKTLEMVNWDLSRDAIAVEFSDTIVEIYNTLNLLNEQPTNDDHESVASIRRLNILQEPVRSIETTLQKIESDREKAEEEKRLAHLNTSQREMENTIRSGKYFVVAEDTIFVISGNTEDERLSSCLSQYPSYPQVKNLTVTRTGGFKYLPFKNKNTYWNALAGCRLALYSDEYLPQAGENLVSITGSFGEENFKIQGTNYASLLHQCMTTAPKYPTQLPEISMSVNAQPLAQVRNDDEWGTRHTFCISILRTALIKAKVYPYE